MAEPDDPIDAWLAEPVRPLPPPPGAFALIRRRARHRKLRQTALSAAAAVVVTAVAAAVPRLVTGQPTGRFLAGQGHVTAASGGSRHHSPTATSSERATPTPVVSGRNLADFRPSSVTFVDAATGWVLGQAGPHSHCPQSQAICTVLARTDNTGASWRPAPAPPAGAPDGATGVSQVRFLNGIDGWVFGPELWATHNGGRSWRLVSTRGARVTALETVHGQTFAIWAKCSGAGPDFAAHCTSYSLYTTPAHRNRWTRVPGVPVLSVGGGPASAELVLSRTEGYLLAPGGQVLRGPVTGGRWAMAAGGAPTPCKPGAPQAGGQPSGEMLATTGPGLVLLCAGPAAGGRQRKTLFYSSDAGQIWRPVSAMAPSAGVAQSLSGSPLGTFLVATSQGVDLSTDGGATWQAASGPFPPGGFSYLGMTYPSQGVAVPAEPGQHALWITHDGGLTWQKCRIR